MHGQEHDFTPESIRETMRKILESPQFQASERNRGFLQHIVDEALAGRANRIKAYSVATIVFGRDKSFDPQTDPIVRIEAGRLRRALEIYYLTAGSQDTIRITIPKGSYAPVFEAISQGPPPADACEPEAIAPTLSPIVHRKARRVRVAGIAAGSIAILVLIGMIWSWQTQTVSQGYHAVAIEPPRGPAILVALFKEGAPSVELPDFAAGMTRSLIAELIRFNDLFVFGPETTLQYGTGDNLERAAPELDVDYILTGGTALTGGHFVVDTLLIDAQTGRYVWADRFHGEAKPSEIFKVRDEIASRVARSLAQPYGVLFANRAADMAGEPPKMLSSYDCVVQFYLYWKTFRAEAHSPVQQCLEETVAADPSYAEAVAALSLVYSDTYRFRFAGRTSAGDSLQRAIELARRAVQLAPNSARAHHALSLALWLANDVPASLKAAEAGLALNPHDTELMAELGMRLVLRDDEQTGVALLQNAFARNPAQPSGYRLPLSLSHYLQGRYEEALAEAHRMNTPNIVYGHIMVAITSAKLGLTDEASAALKRILAIDPEFGDNAVLLFQSRNLHPKLIPVVVDGLRTAGLQIPDGAGAGQAPNAAPAGVVR